MSKKKITYCKSIEESRNKYKEYINNHIKTVQDMYARSAIAFKDVFPNVYKDSTQVQDLFTNLENHDKSKTSYNEFWPYAMRFFPTDSIDQDYEELFEKFKNNFHIAWLHHAHSNPHHPAYWALADDGGLKIYNMPDIYIIEMLCDWMAMSKYYNSTTLDYWKSESAQKLPVSEYTKSKVNEFMEWMTENNVHTIW